MTKEKKIRDDARGNTKRNLNVFPWSRHPWNGFEDVMLEYLAAEFLEFSQFGCLSDLNGGLF